MDIETSWQYFANQVSDIINETISVHKEIRPKNTKPSWMDKYCFKLVEESMLLSLFYHIITFKPWPFTRILFFRLNFTIISLWTSYP